MTNPAEDAGPRGLRLVQEAPEPALHLSEQPLGARPQCSQEEGLPSEDLPSSPPGGDDGALSLCATSEPREGGHPARSHTDGSLATSRTHGLALQRPLCPSAILVR